MRVIKNILLYASFMILLAFQIYNLYIVGPYQYASKNSGTMILEILILCVIIVTINFEFKTLNKYLISILFVLAMAYLHSTIIPLLVVACYFGIIFFAGAGIVSLLNWKTQLPPTAFILGSIITGLNFVCICVSILSVINMYSARNVWLILGIGCIIGLVTINKKIDIRKSLFAVIPDNSKYFNLFISCIEIVALIQIGKAGLQGDYDALWYGIRSPYVLANSSKGIYENLHLVGFTYLYPKGFEVILLPLAEFKSWNYQFLFNSVLAFVIVAIAWHFSKNIADKNIACIIGAAIATLPCLMSMARIVKPDVITVLFQVSAIYFLVLLNKEEKTEYLPLALMCLISSYCFKITSLLFTSITFIAMLPFVNIKKVQLKNGWPYLIYSIITLGFIWGRTYILTGSPLIAFIGSILTKLGFHAKYPYAIVSSINHHGGDLSLPDIIKKLLTGL